MDARFQILDRFDQNADAVIFTGSCLDLLAGIPDNSVQLVVTSPPYNLGKEYERRQELTSYLSFQAEVIRECFRVLKSTGSICWQVGNFLGRKSAGHVIPLDILLYPIFARLGMQLRNRIIWHFEHGLHCKNRLSGRYETVLWFTKTDDYLFHLDPIRIPQKYPGKKAHKGPNAGKFSCNPLGKNPGDVWIFPNVKSNHVEKTEHPCQFPIELVDRLVLSLTNENDWVLDPFAGVGTSMASAVKNGRRGAGADTVARYTKIAQNRVRDALSGTLKYRSMHTPVFNPEQAGKSLRSAPWSYTENHDSKQLILLEKRTRYIPKLRSK
jgi:adenine-specific DNA-methyltransferase